MKISKTKKFLTIGCFGILSIGTSTAQTCPTLTLGQRYFVEYLFSKTEERCVGHMVFARISSNLISCSTNVMGDVRRRDVRFIQDESTCEFQMQARDTLSPAWKIESPNLRWRPENLPTFNSMPGRPGAF